MNINTKVLVLSFLTPLLISQPTYASETDDGITLSKPKLDLFTSLGALKVQGKDFDPESFETQVGLSGMVKAKDFKLLYKLTTELSGAINSRDTDSDSSGSGDIHVKQASVILPSEYGSFVLAPRVVSGQYSDLYANVDLFEYNETHTNTSSTPTGNTLFGQSSEADDLIAWVSPKYKGLKLVLAALSIDEDNGENLDVKAFRAVYNAGSLNFGLGSVITNKTLGSSDKDYVRSAVTAGYQFDRLHLGATYEINNNTFGSSGDYKTLGVATRYYFNDQYSVAAGYYNKNSEVDDNDDDGVVLQVKKELSKNVAFWVEGANYRESSNNLAMGVNLRY